MPTLIKQVIPSDPGDFAILAQNELEFWIPIVCWALQDKDGWQTVVGMVAKKDKTNLEPVTDMPNFNRYVRVLPSDLAIMKFKRVSDQENQQANALVSKEVANL